MSRSGTYATTVSTNNGSTVSSGGGSSSLSERVIEIGERYMIQWRNGQKIAGDIIEIRPLKKYRQNVSSSSYSLSTGSQPAVTVAGSTLSDPLHSHTTQNNETDCKPSECEYYIHFPSFDRRLDEWVSYDRIDTVTMVIGSHSADSNDDPHHSQSSNSRKKVSSSSSASALLKRKYEDVSHGHSHHGSAGSSTTNDKEYMLAKLEREHEEITKVKNINSIILGRYMIDTWYFSPYPDEYCHEDKLRICEYCLKYMKKQSTYRNHMELCTRHSPPGKEIYRENELSMFEIDGREHKIYCQNLCLLSKLFLDHKTLYYDVDPFLFYVLCEVDEHGAHIVGYFSKEKHSQENYNLACILTFPPYQRKGYGKLLISISYELTKREGTTGSPEKPLSDLGRISYRSYWAYVILKYFQENMDKKSIIPNDIARATGIRYEDIISTLHTLRFIRYWKGQHILWLQAKDIENQLAQAAKIRLCNSDCLSWQPPEKATTAAVGARKNL